MHRVDHRSARFGGTRGENGVRRPKLSGRTLVLLGAAVGSFIPSISSAQTWVNPNTGVWNLASNWVAGATPVSGSATQLQFNATGTQSYTASDNIANPFTLNAITFNNSGSGLITLDQSALSFGGANPAINQADSGNALISNALQLTTDLSFAGSGSGGVTLGAAITSSPAATGTTGASIINNNSNGQLVMLGGTTGGNLYGLRLSSGNTFIQSGSYTLSSTQRGSDPFDSVNDGKFWSFIVGNTAGQTARFTMTAGTIAGQNGMIGNVANANGIATFSGVGTSATFAAAQGRFGTNTGNGTINILNGATVSARRGDIIRNTGGTGFVNVSGTGSKLTLTQELNLPLSSGNATLTVANGGTISLVNADFFLASAITPTFNAISSNASATVTGPNAGITATGDGTSTGVMLIGFGATGVPAAGTLTISSGGVVDAVSAFIGRGDGTGTVSVSGSGSRLNVGTFQVVLGSTTASSINVSNGATWTNPGDSFTSTNSTDRAIINVNGTNALANLSGVLVLSGGGGAGVPGGSSTLNIGGGGELRVATLFAADNPDGRANVFVNGANSKLTLSNQAILGDAANANAAITVDGGANMNVNSAAFLSPAVNAISTLTVSGAGSSYTSTGATTELHIGGNGGVAGGTATFAVNDGATASIAGATLVYLRGNLNIGSGALPGSFTSATNSVDGTVNFNSGTFNTTGTLSVGGSVLLSSAARNGAGTPANKKLLEAGTLSLTASGVVDLNDNDALLHSTSLVSVQNKIRDARNGGLWNAAGITSTAAKNATPKNTSLGAISGTDFHAAQGGAATFDNRVVANSDTLVKYTYYGDTDLNGVVNFDDYARTDNGFNNNRTGWFNGDFDYNGIVNFDDYSLIDLAFNTQGAVVLASGTGERAGPGQREIMGVAMRDSLFIAGQAPVMIEPTAHTSNIRAVPEPSVAAMAGFALLAAASRRLRRRAHSQIASRI